MQYSIIESERKAFALPFSGQKNPDKFVDNMMKYLRLGSSHVIQYLSPGYKRGVITKYDVIALTMLYNIGNVNGEALMLAAYLLP